jgi:hypothetical protein
MIKFICFVYDGKYVYYTEKHNRFESDEELDDLTIQHFEDLEQLERNYYLD